MKIQQNYLDCAIETNVIIFKESLEDLIKTLEIYTKKRKWLNSPYYWEDTEPEMINCAFGATQ